jgi:amino acid adenylation domain-containing protein
MSTDPLAFFLDHARRRPDASAVEGADRALTYRQLADEVDRVARGLGARGVVEGDRVALHLPNSVDFVVAALASLWVGALFVPLAVTDPDARVDAIVADCLPVLVVTSDDGPTVGRPLAGSSLGFGHPPWVRFSDLTVSDPTPRQPCVADASRPAYAIYTSGTTGVPKGVLISNGAFLAAVRSTVEIVGIDRHTRALCVSPFHFDGSFATLFPTLLVGGTVIVRPREALLFPRTFFNTVRKERISYTGFTPTYLKLLLASPQVGELRGGTLQILGLGGEASAAADIRALWEAAPQIRVFNRYGPTETTIAVTHIELTPDLLADSVVPLGRPHPGVTFYLVDDKGALIETVDEVGELYIGGTQLMNGYWGAPELTDEVLRSDIVPDETVYRTGDLVFRNGGGDYVYVDRADRVIKRFGVRISLLEMAHAMRNLPGVSGAACVVFDNGGEVGIAAFVVTDQSLSASALRHGVNRWLPDTMLPDRVELVDQLPLTSSSKLDEGRLLLEVGLHGVGERTPLTAAS